MPTRRKSIIADFLERAGWTAGQQFFAVLLATKSSGTVIDLPWKVAFCMAAGAAVVSIVTTAIQYLAKLTELAFWPDLLVRLAKTFLASLAGSFGAEAFNVLDFKWSSALDLAVIATLGALAKGLLARQAQGGNGANPSTLPNATYATAIKV